MPPHVIRDPQELSELIERLGRAEEIALDCEFHGEGRYRPELFLVQVADGADAWAIDPRSVDLRPLGPLLSSRSLCKLFHCGREDVRLLERATGAAPAEVFDTQVAAAFLGHGPSVGYAALVEATLGLRLDKGSQLSRWDGPLTPEQIEYALDDVRYLGRVAEKLRGELRARGRLEWAEEESRAALSRARSDADPSTLFRRVRGQSRLSGAEQGLLRELALWREEIAESVNKPVGSVANDAGLIHLACRPPERKSELRDRRGLLLGASGRHWEGLRQAIERGRARPEPEEAPTRDSSVEGALQLLYAVRRRNAELHQIAPSLLASEEAIRELIGWVTGGEEAADRPALLAGWREALIGREMGGVLRGELALRVDLSSPSGMDLVEVPGGERAPSEGP